MLTLLRSAYGEQGLDYPGISSITEHDFKGARDLNRAAHAADTEVLAVKFHGARRGEVDGMRHALAAGARMLMDDLQVVFRAPIVIGLHRSYEAALTPHAGALYVPEDTLAPIATQAAESLHLTLPVHTDSAAG